MEGGSLNSEPGTRPAGQIKHSSNCRWVVSKNGTQYIGDCQEQLWEIRAELEGIGSLIRCVDGEAEILSEGLFGLGTWLKHLTLRLQTAEGLLGQVFEESTVEDINQAIKSL